jgi:uncharacterized membrane protein (Fun14 family)
MLRALVTASSRRCGWRCFSFRTSFSASSRNFTFPRKSEALCLQSKLGTFLRWGVLFLGAAACLSQIGVVAAETVSDSDLAKELRKYDSLHPKAIYIEKESKTIGFLTSLIEDLSVGTLLGVAAGFALRVLGKSLLFVLGIELILLQYLAWKDVIRINWTKLTESSTVHMNRRKEYLRRLVSLLTYKIPFKAGFIGGLYIGLTNPFQ